MERYDHAYTLAFSLESCCPDADDVTDSMVEAAIQQFLAEFRKTPGSLVAACGAPFDTYKVDS